MTGYIKSICLLMIFGIGSVFNVAAQKTFRVYNNDGSMDVFFYSALDSITFTPSEDIEGSLIQNIHTSDSTYSFRTCEIDSVSFQSVPTVFKPAVVQIEGKLREYIIGSESLCLLFKLSVPKSILPKIGDNIVTLDCDDVLPNGFVGKVKDIVFGSDYVRIECDKPSLFDVFESLSIEESITSEEADEEAFTRGPLDIWPSKHFNLIIPSIRGEISLSHEDEMGLNFSSSYDMTAFAELSTEKCDLNIAFFITPMAFQTPQVYLSLSYYAQNTFSIGSSLCASFKWDKEMSVLPIKRINLPGPVGALLDFFIDGGAYVGFEGKLGVNGQFTKPYTTVMRYVYDNKAATAISPVFKMIGGEAKSETTLEGNASVSIGLYGKIGVSPIVPELAEIDAGFKTGITISTATEFPVDIPPIDAVNTKFYDALDRDDYFRGDFFLSGEFSAEMLDSKILGYKLEIGDIIASNPVFTKGIVPHFSDVELLKGAKATTLCASAQVSRSLMFNTNVGLALYDEDNHIVDKWWSPTEYKDNEGEVISHCFEGLLPEASYILHPITRLFKDNFVANPCAECNLKPYIITGEAKNITNSQATLSAQIDVEEDVEYIAGFYYLDSNGHKREISTSGRGMRSLELTAVDLQENIEYTYAAFIKIGDIIENGEEMTFKTYGLGGDIKVVPDTTLADISSSSADVGYNFYVGSNRPYSFGAYYYEDGGVFKFFPEGQGFDSGGVAFVISNLKADTKYTCVAYVKYGERIVYGEPQIFRTLRENDEVDPIFKCTQKEVKSTSNYIETVQEFEEINGGNSGKYIIHPSGCFTKAKNLHSDFRGLELGSQFNASFDDSNFYEPCFDYVNYHATGKEMLVVKYALVTDPNEWYFTKLPINMFYDTPPLILSYDVRHCDSSDCDSRGCNVYIELKGSYWISNIIVDAELWDTVQRRGEDGSSWLEEVKVEERTFELSPYDFFIGYFHDGINSVVLWPQNNCVFPYVKINSVAIVPKN